VSLLQLAETNGIVTPPSTSSHTTIDSIVAPSVFIANRLMFFLFFRTHDDQQQKQGQHQERSTSVISYFREGHIIRSATLLLAVPGHHIASIYKFCFREINQLFAY